MRVQINTKKGCAESVDLNCNTTEFLIIMSALKQYVRDLINHPDNIKLATSMISTDFVFKEIEELTQHKGKWIAHGLEAGFAFERYSCSECDYDIGVITTNYCPNCGADMRGEEDERTD